MGESGEEVSISQQKKSIFWKKSYVFIGS